MFSNMLVGIVWTCDVMYFLDKRASGRSKKIIKSIVGEKLDKKEGLQVKNRELYSKNPENYDNQGFPMFVKFLFSIH